VFSLAVGAHYPAEPAAAQEHRQRQILAAAPCTAMVFVWSFLTDGDSVLRRPSIDGAPSGVAAGLFPSRLSHAPNRPR